MLGIRPTKGVATLIAIMFTLWLGVALAQVAPPAAPTTPAEPAAAAPAPVATPIGTVEPGQGRALLPIAIPPFPTSGGVPVDLAKVIANDLDLSGFFNTQINQQFVIETNRGDQGGQINYAEWHRIGALYLVKGEVQVQGGNLVVTIKTYDTVQQAYVFGRQYQDYAVGEARALAHQVSNDLIERLTGQKGVADTRILFIRAADRLGKVKQVCVMDADGANIRSLTGNELAATPAWGARGTEIYYTTYKDFNPDLAGLILRTGATWWISRRGGFNLSPAWSEQQQLITLTLTKDGNSEIYTLNREGKNLRRLTVDRAIDSTPSWSPDGSQIVFTSDRSGNPQIYVMDVASTSAHRLSFNSSYCDGASWAPGGSNRIAYTARINGEFKICTVNPNGSDPQVLPNQSGNNEDPSWSPNGWTMTFTSDRDGTRQIYEMYADGTAVHRLTNGGAAQSSAWGPSANNKK